MAKNSLPNADVLKRTLALKASMSDFALRFVESVIKDYSTASQEEVEKIGDYLDLMVSDIKQQLNLPRKREILIETLIKSSNNGPKQEEKAFSRKPAPAVQNRLKPPSKKEIGARLKTTVLDWTRNWMAKKLNYNVKMFRLPHSCQASALWCAVDCKHSGIMNHKRFLEHLERDKTIVSTVNSLLAPSKSKARAPTNPKSGKKKEKKNATGAKPEKKEEKYAEVEQSKTEPMTPEILAEGFHKLVGNYFGNFSKWVNTTWVEPTTTVTKARKKNLKRTAQASGKRWRDLMVTLKRFPANPSIESAVTGNLSFGQFANQLNVIRGLRAQLKKLREVGNNYIPVVAALMPFNEPKLFATLWKKYGGKIDQITAERPWQAFQMSDPDEPKQSWAENKNLIAPVPREVWIQWETLNPDISWLAGLAKLSDENFNGSNDT